MARIFQVQAKDTVYRFNDTDVVSCIQTMNWDGQMNAQQLAQIGSANYDAQTVDPAVTANMEVRSTGSSAALFSRMIFDWNQSTGEFEPPAVVYATLNDSLIKETDFERAIVDIIESKKASEQFDRSTLIPRAHLSSWSLSTRSDGSATETFAFEADLLEVYRKPYHDLRSIPCVRGTPADTTIEIPLPYEVELSNAVVAGADWKIAAIDIDGERIPATTANFTHAAGAGAVEDTLTLTAGAVTAGYTIPLGGRIQVIVYKKTPGTFPTIVNTTPTTINSNYSTTARFVKADSADLFLVPQSATFSVTGHPNETIQQICDGGGDLNEVVFTNANLLFRCQQMDLQVPLTREALREIRKNNRGNSVYYRAITFPLDITASLQMFETDLNEWARIQGKDLLGADATPDILDLAGFETPQWMLVKRFYKGDSVLQTVVLHDAKVAGLGNRQEVRGRAVISYNFTGSKLYLKGSNV